MTLVLLGIALNDEPMSQPLVGRFDERGGTLGRSETATFTLPDPERIISRSQAEIVHRDAVYWIENVSGARPMLHNGRALSAGMRVLLREGDELRVGGYTLVVAFEDDPASATVLRGRTLVMAHDEVRASPPATASAAAVNAAPATPVLTQSAPTGAGADELWRSFLRGAELDSLGAQPASAETFAAIGAMLRIAVTGIHQLIAMRAAAKDEIHAQMTMLMARGNNPLKFAADPAMALQLLLQPPVRGFLEGSVALQDAMNDLQAHQVGMVAGMRSAVEGVLDRIDPAVLKTRLSSKSVFDSLLPANRKARLWELFEQQYGTLREEAREEFQRFLGESFRSAYEAQIKNLEAGMPKSTKPDAGVK